MRKELTFFDFWIPGFDDQSASARVSCETVKKRGAQGSGRRAGQEKSQRQRV